MDLYTNLERLCKFLEKELETANKKLEDAGRMSGDDLSYVDKLSHSIKSVKTTMAMLEGTSYDGGYGNSGNYSGNNNGGYSRNNSGRYGGNSYGRGRYAQRDSMGRYSGAGQVDDVITQLHEIMQDAPDDQTRREYEKIISKLENM